jgi:hypothetical protein
MNIKGEQKLREFIDSMKGAERMSSKMMLAAVELDISLPTLRGLLNKGPVSSKTYRKLEKIGITCCDVFKGE